MKGVLVVDDEPGIIAVLTSMLSFDGYEVETAGNGIIALEKLRESTYDVILSDITMPELDGPSLYRALEERYPHLCQRMIFLTGASCNADTDAFLQETGARVLSKPFRLEEIRQHVQGILAASQREGSA